MVRGFIGLEMAENLKDRGIDVTIVEMANQVLPALDSDMAVYVETLLQEWNLSVITGETVISFDGAVKVDEVVLQSGKRIKTEIVIMAAEGCALMFPWRKQPVLRLEVLALFKWTQKCKQIFLEFMHVVIVQRAILY